VSSDDVIIGRQTVKKERNDSLYILFKVRTILCGQNNLSCTSVVNTQENVSIVIWSEL
jgi:hypothetical protein